MKINGLNAKSESGNLSQENAFPVTSVSSCEIHHFSDDQQVMRRVSGDRLSVTATKWHFAYSSGPRVRRWC
ncbi:MAG: hypothetical protein KGZ67_02115 [Hydrogenophaga sp.]|jgi:hypothetical protein|nr:hypothetical protein [Hydrogenophaga sp.]